MMHILRTVIATLIAMLATLPSTDSTWAQSRPYSPSFSIAGQVAAPRSYTLADLRQLPSEDLAVEFTSGGEPRQHTYRGVRLYDLLMVATPQFGPNPRADALRWYVLVTASDAYQAVIAWGEIDPSLEAKNS